MVWCLDVNIEDARQLRRLQEQNGRAVVSTLRVAAEE